MSWFRKELDSPLPPRTPLISKAKPISCPYVGDPSEVPELRIEKFQAINQTHMPKTGHERRARETKDENCYYNTLVYTCTHSTPHPNLPNITHTQSCPSLSIDTLSSNCLCNNMAPSPSITHVTTKCPSCILCKVYFSNEKERVQRAARLDQYISPFNRDMSFALPLSELEKVKQDQLDQNLVIPNIADRAAERGTRSQRDIMRAREARRQAEMVESNVESITPEEVIDTIRKSGNGGSAKEHIMARTGVDAKIFTLPLSDKARDILRGVYEKDAKSRIVHFDNPAKTEKKGNKGVARYDQQGLLILPYKPRLKPTEEKSASSPAISKAASTRQDSLSHGFKVLKGKAKLHLDQSATVTPKLPSPFTCYTTSKHNRVKTDYRQPTTKFCKDPASFKNPEMNAQPAQIGTNKEKREAAKDTAIPDQFVPTTSPLKQNPFSSFPPTTSKPREPENKHATKATPLSNTEPLSKKYQHTPTQTSEIKNILDDLHPVRENAMQRLRREVDAREAKKALEDQNSATARITEKSESDSSVSEITGKMEIDASVKGEKEDDWEDISSSISAVQGLDEDAEWEMV